MINRWIASLAMSVLIVGLAISSACGDVTRPDVAATPAQPLVATTGGPAVDALNRLLVKGRAPMTGYSRSAFGNGWADPDGNGCDARRDVLARQAVGTPVRKGKAQCVFTADIVDPYTGTTIASTAADVDHVVALGDAWQTGGQQLSAAQREALANDPLELLAVTASLNRSKGDSNAASWLPPRDRCGYVSRQIAVKIKYQLWVLAPERDAMARVLAACPGQRLP
jgi:hypothetical protein